MNRTLIFATNNRHKLAEVSSMLEPKYEIVGLDALQCTDELPEDQTTLEGNALQKARYIRDRYGVDCFADDTGLEVKALNGDPGVYSARYAGPLCLAADNIAKLLIKLEGIEKRKARFRTVIALLQKGEEYLFEGVVEGVILKEPRGKGGFGYDSVFLPDGYELCFGEMDAVQKNKISHRARAINRLVDFLKRQSC